VKTLIASAGVGCIDGLAGRLWLVFLPSVLLGKAFVVQRQRCAWVGRIQAVCSKINKFRSEHVVNLLFAVNKLISSYEENN
jgi:hypothetical protein